MLAALNSLWWVLGRLQALILWMCLDVAQGSLACNVNVQDFLNFD